MKISLDNFIVGHCMLVLITDRKENEAPEIEMPIFSNSIRVTVK